MAKIKRLEGRIENVELAKVTWDDRYQRGVQRHHEFIQENFNPAAAGVLMVSLRPDDSMVWLDGLQRATALMKLGVTHWKANVIDCDSIEYEAELFRLVNDKKGRKGLNPRELFKAALVAKDPIALGVVEVLTKYGLKVSSLGGHGFKQGWPHVTCVGLLYRLYGKSNGKDNLDRVFDLIVKMWPEDDNALHESIIGALTMLVRQRAFEEARLLDTVGNKPPKTIRMSAEGAGGTRHAAVADRMIAIYNSRLRTGSGKALKLFADKSLDDEGEEERKLGG